MTGGFLRDATTFALVVDGLAPLDVQELESDTSLESDSVLLSGGIQV